MGHEVLIFLIIACTVTLWKHVMSQCSEAHNVACSLSLIQLEKYDAMMYPISGYMPDYNQSTLTDLCGIFQEYINCSRPFLSSCNKDIVTQLNVLESAFIPICQDFTTEYILHRSCYKSHERSYAMCQQRRQEELNALPLDENEIQYKIHTCNITNQYLQCVYIATSLGCSLEAANIYFNILNQTISLMMRDSNFICNIRHPRDVIQVFTTTTSTTTVSSTSSPSSRTTQTIQRTTGPTSDSNHIMSSALLLLFLAFVHIFMTHIFFDKKLLV